MSYCLKTGGLTYVEESSTFHESDLHIVGDCLVAVTSHPSYHDGDPQRITAFIPEGVHFLDRTYFAPFGVIVVPFKYVAISKGLASHINQWYKGQITPDAFAGVLETFDGVEL